MSPAPLLNRKQVAERLHTSPDHVTSLVDNGTLPAHNIGTEHYRILRFDPDQLDEWLERSTVRPRINFRLAPQTRTFRR